VADLGRSGDWEPVLAAIRHSQSAIATLALLDESGRSRDYWRGQFEGIGIVLSVLGELALSAAPDEETPEQPALLRGMGMSDSPL
jgi:hypothetical protein